MFFLNIITLTLAINGLFAVFNGPVFMGPYFSAALGVANIGLWLTWYKGHSSI